MWIPLSHHLFFACYLFRMLFNFVWLHDFEWVSETHLARPTQLPYLIVETFLTLRLVMHLCFNVIVDCRQQLLLLNLIWTYIKFYIIQSRMLHPASTPHGFLQLYKMFLFFPRRPYLEEPRNVTVQKGAEPLGISIVSGENGGVFVSKVTAGSIAHQARLEYGDQLLEVQQPPCFN